MKLSRMMVTIVVGALALTTILAGQRFPVANGASVPGREAALVHDLDATARPLSASMVEIVDERGQRSGYGVVVAPHLVLTSTHQDLNASPQAGKPRQMIRDRAGQLYAFELKSHDQNDSLALLEARQLPGDLPTFDPANYFAETKVSPARAGAIVASIGVDPRPIAAGIISAANRRVSGKESFAPVPIRGAAPGAPGPARTSVRFFPEVLQHDSLLHMTELGSLLVSVRGEPLGMNVSNVLHGISYAVPMHSIARVLPELMRGQSIAPRMRGFIGIEAYPASNELLRKLNSPGAVVVRNVSPGQPAQRAGVQPGDVVIAIDGRNILDTLELVQAVSARTPGEQAIFSIYRQDRVFEVPVEIGRTGW